MPVARAGFVSMDCADPGVLGRFWADLLGGEVVFDTERLVVVGTSWIWITALKIDDYVPPSWPDGTVPKQMHLDLAVEDLDAAADDAVRLGARLLDEQPAPDRWRVLLDPAGHPFCVTSQVPQALIDRLSAG